MSLSDKIAKQDDKLECSDGFIDITYYSKDDLSKLNIGDFVKFSGTFCFNSIRNMIIHCENSNFSIKVSYTPNVDGSNDFTTDIKYETTFKGIWGSYPLGIKLHTDCAAVYVMFGRDILGLPRYAKTFNFRECNRSSNKDYYIALADKFYSHYDISMEQYQKCVIGMAFEDFCIEKKKYMKDVANLYKNYELNGKIYNLLSNEAYNSIVNWEFDISD